MGSSTSATFQAQDPANPGTNPSDYKPVTVPGNDANVYGVGAAGLTAIGGIGKAFAEYRSGQANADIDRYNASMDQIQAQQATQQGELRANIQESRGNVLRGQQRAAAAGSGVIAGAGSAAAVQAGSEATSQMDQMLIRLNASRQAFGYQSRAAIADTEAEFAKTAGTNAALATLVETAGRENLYADPNYKNRSGGGGGGAGFF